MTEAAKRRGVQRTQAMQMEGTVARWYARTRSSPAQLEEFRRQAAELTADLPPGAAVLEVAPGPGYLAVEMARLGRCRVTGLDMSRTFIAMAAEHARRTGVEVRLRQGDAASLPFPDESFDRVICQAAFKNFGQPGRALDEMHRVLRPGGVAVIHDMRREATAAEIADEVRRAGATAWNALGMKAALRGLRRRAYSVPEFHRLVAESAFGTADIRSAGIGMEIRLTKSASA